MPPRIPTGTIVRYLKHQNVAPQNNTVHVLNKTESLTWCLITHEIGVVLFITIKNNNVSTVQLIAYLVQGKRGNE